MRASASASGSAPTSTSASVRGSAVGGGPAGRPRRASGAGPRTARAAALALLALEALAGATCATGGGAGRGDGERADRWVGRPAPELVVERLDGRKLALSSLRGQVVLLDVWASWCIPCKQELPMLDGIAGRLRGRGVEVLAVSIDQERENVQKFLRGRGLEALTVAHDPGGAIAEALQPDKMPTSYAIDRDGTVRYVNSGFEPADARVIEGRLAELAAAPAGGGARPGAGNTAERRRRPQ